MSLEKQNALSLWAIAEKRLMSWNVNVYRQWFRKMVPLELDGVKLSLGVSDDFFAQLVIDTYDDFLDRALQDVDGVDYSWALIPGHNADEQVTPSPEPEEIVAAPVIEPEVKPAPVASGSPRSARGNLLHRHTFDNFVVGAENRCAFSAARNAAESPGLYNPLYLYGGSGTGKTHLLKAIENAVHDHSRSLRVRYATCDELLTDFYNLLQQKQSLSQFRASVRDVDVLLIDDVHSLAKKPQMQEEFFNMFNTLYHQNKQIVLTSDRQPSEINDLDKRLTTRFEAGMTAELGVPDFEARLAILKMLRSELISKNQLSDSLLEFLANNISSSVRRLKGAFLRLTGFVSMSGNDRLSIEQAEDILHVQLEEECRSRDISLGDIQSAVAAHFSITVPLLLGKGRSSSVAKPRMIAMYLSRELTRHSSTEIGEAFGRNHATILYAEKTVPELCAHDDSLARSVSQLKKQLQHH